MRIEPLPQNSIPQDTGQVQALYEIKPVGWAEHNALADARATFRAGRRAHEKAGLSEGRPALFAFCYAALRGLLAAGFGSTFFSDLAFSFAANSCLTLRAIASVSTL